MTQRKLLLAASTGGHLAQLIRMAPALGASDDSLWVTFRTPQSESLLRGRRVMYVPYIRARDLSGTLAAARLIGQALKNEAFSEAISTGSAIALSALPMARAHGVPATYIESISRVNGPSLSGRLLAASQLVQVRTQHPSWADRRWQSHPPVLATYQSNERQVTHSPRLFVTLGTIEGFRFDSLVDQVLASGLANETTTWQLGHTNREGLPGRSYLQMPAEDFVSAARSADVVISHAGVGTLLQLLDEGIYPVLVTRRRDRGEHVDDHQMQIAGTVNELNIGFACDAPELTRDSIIQASGRYVVGASASV